MENLLTELDMLLTKYNACICLSAKKGVVTLSKINDDGYIDCEFVEEISPGDIENDNYNLIHKEE